MKPTIRLIISLFLIPFSLLITSSAGPVNIIAVAQTQTGANERPPLDQLIDVGGYRLHLKCIGTGNPTVILEAGQGGGSDDWDMVMPEVAKHTRVCAYDRAGRGTSDPARRKLRRFDSHTYIELRNGQEVVRDLHTLLAKAGEGGPYVIAAHSLGGLFAILYTHQYPKEIVGLVFVDISHPDQTARADALTTPEMARRRHDGLMQNREGVDIDEILAQVRALNWRTSVSLYVLARGATAPPSADWTAENWAKYGAAQREMQQDHARRSSNSKLIIAEKSGHAIHQDQPELVIDAIKQVVNIARTK
jgi:pimeloyl-ACP methyl ester carboxylesterase